MPRHLIGIVYDDDRQEIHMVIDPDDDRQLDDSAWVIHPTARLKMMTMTRASLPDYQVAQNGPAVASIIELAMNKLWPGVFAQRAKARDDAMAAAAAIDAAVITPLDAPVV